MGKSRIHNSSLLLLQGSMLMMLGLFVLLRPGNDFQQLVNVTGIFSIWYGIVSMFKFLFGEEKGRVLPELFSGIVMIVLGVVLFRNHSEEQFWQVPVMAFLFLVMSLQVFQYAVELTFSYKWWKISVVIVLVSILVAFNLLSGKTLFQFPRYVFPGIQMLVLGSLMIWLSLLDRVLEVEYRKTLGELKKDGVFPD